MKKLLSAFMASLFVLTASIGSTVRAYAVEDNTTTSRSELNFAEMANGHYEATKLYEALDEMESLLEEENNEERILVLYEIIFEELDMIFTSSTINQIYYNKDVTNEQYANENAYYVNITTEAYDKVYSTLKKALSSPYRDALVEVMGEDLAESIDSYSEMDENDYELSQKEQDLVQQYEQCAVKEYKATVFGETWTEEQLEQIADELTEEEYNQIYTAIKKSKNDELGKIFVDLVKVRDRIAEASGYDSYADYAYETLYCRDYSTDDIKKVYKNVKKYLVPLSMNLSYNIGSVDISALNLVKDNTDQDILNKLGMQMKKISPDLDYSFKHMMKHQLYDIKNEPTKLDVGYTCFLNSYGVPFIFNSPYNTYNDFKDMVHEFGHFNNAFYQEEHILSTDYTPLDVCEIHSQALELLFMEYSNDIYGEGIADAVNYVTVMQIIQAVIQGCLNDEFQVEVYENPDLTLDEINQLYKEIGESYGLYYLEDETKDYSWVDIGHTFQSPMYYISYATSGLSSLDLWSESFSDRDAAIEKYMNIALNDNNMDYKQVIAENELRDIFNRKDMAKLATDVAEYMNVSSDFAQKDIMSTLTLGIIVAIVLVIICMVIMSRKEKKKLAQIEKLQDDLVCK